MILFLLFGAAAAVVVLDAVTKQAVTGRVAAGHPAPTGRWGVRVVTNHRGGLVGLGVGGAVVLLVAVSASAAMLSVVAGDHWLALGLGATVGGAAANVGDRVRRGSVIDFVAAGPWPVFNLADAAMVVGLVLCVWTLV